MFAIRHASVVIADTVLEDGTVFIADGRVQAVGDSTLTVPNGAHVRDATGLILAPGFLDLQVLSLIHISEPTRPY